MGDLRDGAEMIGSAALVAAGLAAVGIAAVLVISAVFYAVGRGEDRDRSDAARAAEQAAPDRERPADRDARPVVRRPLRPASARGRRRR
ncbi:MAG TPA: hypothetical protein VGF63_07260 [Solirubrobacteraceae bacterium]